VSLGILIKGSEGVVLAADSRVTLFNQIPNPQVQGQIIVLPASFDNATKLLKVTGQDYVGAVTYGLGAFITPAGPRTMHSFIPEFEAQLKQADIGRLGVQDFAQRLSDFFLERWNTLVGRPANAGEEIVFLVGGYDEGASYGRAFLFLIPAQPIPAEQNATDFGITWGGQSEVAFRLLYGYDGELLAFIRTQLGLTQAQVDTLTQQMRPRFDAGIPYQFLPLQDCVDLAVFLIRNTISFQQFRTTVRGVGGPVQVATVTQAEGFQPLLARRITAPA
jgi:hypothetical protein